MRRFLFILDLALLALLLALWVGSYWRQPIVIVRGYGGTFDRGAFYCAGPHTLVVETRATWESASPIRIERLLLQSDNAVQPWKPVRHLERSGDSIWMVEAWAVALALAVPAVLLWRRRRRDVARGFEVATATGGNP